MPAVPRFTVSQTDEAVAIVIKVPHVRVGNAETHVDGQEFSFYCKPYLLRLTLPYDVVGEDDESCKAVYDPANDNGTITVTLPKATPGLHFPDLDLTTTLMQPRWTPKDLLREKQAEGGGAGAGSGIEVLGSEHYDVPDEDETDLHRGEQTGGVCGHGWHDSNNTGGRLDAGVGKAAGNRGDGGPSTLGRPVILIRPPHYGFNDKFSGFFSSLRDELREMIQLPDPDGTPSSARRGLRLKHEAETFDGDRYLGDLFSEEEDPILVEALDFRPHWLRRKRTKVTTNRQTSNRPVATPVDNRPSSEASEASAPVSDSRGTPFVDEISQGFVSSAVVSPVRDTSTTPNVVATADGSQAVSVVDSGGEEQSSKGAAGIEVLKVSGSRDAAGVGTGRGDGGGKCGVGGEGVARRRDVDDFEGFSEEEQEQMRRLPNREYLIPAGGDEERRVLLGLADILFAYAYDHRTTGGDPSVESAWTVATLSPLLSWLETPEADAGEASVAIAGIRRSLIFPYLRVWELGVLVARDVGDILSAGRRCILRCLLQTYAILERREVHYLLNKLFVEDYCIWIQKVSEESLAAFAERYARATASPLEKRDVRLDLEKLEADACGVSLMKRTVGRGGVRGGRTSTESAGQSLSEEETTSEEEEEKDRESSSDESDSSSGEEEETSDSEPDSEDESGTEPAIDVPAPGSARKLDHDSKYEQGMTPTTTARVSQVVAEIKLPLEGTGASLKATDSGTRATSCGGGSEAAATATTPREERSSAPLHLESSPTLTGGGGPSGVSIASRLSVLSLSESKGIPRIDLGDGAAVGGVDRSGDRKAEGPGDRADVGRTAKTLIQEL